MAALAKKPVKATDEIVVACFNCLSQSIGVLPSGQYHCQTCNAIGQPEDFKAVAQAVEAHERRRRA